MRNLLLSIFVLAALLFTHQIVKAQGKPQAIFSTRNFLLNGKRPYVETYLMIRGSSVRFEKTGAGKFQGSVEVMCSISKKGKVTYTDRYNLLSPETTDSLGRSFNFIDQQRVPLDTGNYLVELSIRDLVGKTDAVKAYDSIIVNQSDGITFSGIQLVDAYTKPEKPGKLTKGGFDLVPRPLDYFGAGEDKLIVYTELYNTLNVLGPDKRYLVRYWIEDPKNGAVQQSFSGFRKFNSSEVGILMQEFNIERLASGTYQVVFEARNQDNELLARATQSVLRSNPGLILSMEEVGRTDLNGTFAEAITNKDSLAEFIHSLHPVSSIQERIFADNLLTAGEIKLMQQFFLTFWQNRNTADPAQAWLNYRKEVIKVNRQFGTSIRKGYDTDRGRVYLQYGSPDNRTESLHEPSAYPYEIWHYYRLGRQTNRRFVFYNPDLVTNDYTLIHSDALGEIMNDQWHLLLMKRDTQTNDIDATAPGQHFGTQIQQNFQAPR
jgi:GWxTD domain-containing protein